MNMFRKISLILLLVSVLLSVNQIIQAQQQPVQTEEVITLEVDKPIEREMTGSDVHAYQIALDAGQFLQVVVDQRGIDVVVRVFGPDGEQIAEVDSPTGTQGPEKVKVEAKEAGTYRLEVRPYSTKQRKPGRYEIKITHLLSAEEYAVYLEAERAKRQAVIDWLRQNAIPLKTVEAGHGFADMQPLKKLIGDARLVALGEATHGTREFFQLKHRILEFLITEMGFTIFGIEAGMPEAFDVNEYVLTGKGDPGKALCSLPGSVWDTEEVLEMIQWMRRYNADPCHEKKVKFYGFDARGAPRAVKVTLAYLRKVVPEQAMQAEEELGVLGNPYTAAYFRFFSQERKEATAKVVHALLKRLDEHKQDYVKHTSATAWALARQHAEIIAQSISGVRDSSMAENIRWILEYEGPEAKMVVWAHNWHVATDPGWRMMGARLRKMFGHDMVVFGFAFNQGSFNALDLTGGTYLHQGWHSFHVGPAPDRSLDKTLAEAGLSIATIDLRELPQDGPVAEWFAEPNATRNIGAAYNEKSPENYFDRHVVTRSYDALLFVETTTAARDNPWVMTPPVQLLAAPANLDFEEGEPGKPPADWLAFSEYQKQFDFHIITSEHNPYSGKRCALISRKPGKHYGEKYGSLSQMIDAAPYRSKRIRLRAAVRTEVKGPGNQAYMWLNVWKKGFAPSDLAFHDNMADRPITGSEWRIYEIAGEVSSDAATIDYGFALVGEGKAWIDSVSVQEIHK